MSNMFFWIIVLSFLIPIGMRWYKKSVRGRNQNQDFPGQFPGGQPGRPNNQPRDGYTQQDYFSGGFRQLGGQLPPVDPPYQNPGYPGQVPQDGRVPYEDSPQYPVTPRREEPQQPAAPVTPPPPSAPQGFRARKLAELDQRFSNGEIAMEEYMARRDEIMKG